MTVEAVFLARFPNTTVGLTHLSVPPNRHGLPADCLRGKMPGMALPFARLISLLKPKRSWLQFRLRTLFVLVVVAAMPCVWLAWKKEPKRRERAAVAAIEKDGGTVWYHWQAESKK